MARREPITAPAARPPRFGLIASAPTPDLGAARWQDGFIFQPEACGAAGRLELSCEGNTAVMDPGDQPENQLGVPFVVYAADHCSTFGYAARDWQGRARRQLAATESADIAAELWTGSLGIEDANGDPLVSLANPEADTLNTGSAADPIHSLALLEQGLATCLRGRQGMIHVTPQLLTYLVTNDSVTLNGSVYLTPSGHIVVPDAGYPGTGPNGEAAGTTQWAYATSLIQVILGPVDVVPTSLASAQDRALAVDRAVNDLTVWAYRLAAWQWDHCCHLAVHVDLAMPLVGGAS